MEERKSNRLYYMKVEVKQQMVIYRKESQEMEEMSGQGGEFIKIIFLML